ncbi:MAG: MMPL family transporter, partial [Sinobacterium sp.]|nr:MMPL family transporter [Sinobacterium sp.]
LYEMSLPYGLDLNDQLTLGKQRSRLLMGMPAIDTQTLMDIERRVLDWQEQNLPPTMRHKGASMSIIWAHLSYDSLKSSLEGSVIALILISIILLLVLKSWRYGIVSLIPNLLPAAFGFGGWYLYSGEIGIGLTCVVIITIGIVVDDTVHFLTKYKKAMQNNAYNAEAAIRTTFKQVGPAICITTLVLSSGFFVLSLSKIVTNSALGGVTVMILIAAFILDVLLLPAILLVIDKRKYK